MRFLTFFLIFLGMSVLGQAKDFGDMAPWYALVVQNLDRGQKNDAIPFSGPRAALTAMTTLGYTVEDMTFNILNSQSCDLTVKMEPKITGSRKAVYTFHFDKKSQNNDESYQFAQTVCFKLGKESK